MKRKQTKMCYRCRGHKDVEQFTKKQLESYWCSWCKSCEKTPIGDIPK